MDVVLTQFIGILVGGITEMATGIATGVASMASALFLETGTGGTITGLSTFGGIVGIFAALGLAVSLTTRVYTWVTSLGN